MNSISDKKQLITEEEILEFYDDYIENYNKKEHGLYKNINCIYKLQIIVYQKCI